MRYLNKVVFINSASIKYSEIAIDGNVHFIGTQGVGKSTTLRAILFFYNADKLKLGISREKKSYDEYYFPYANSYVIYEVVRETGPFCVMCFKSQGRVCFRFFDSAYDKNFFVDDKGKAHESWEKTRTKFGKSVGYSKVIDSYEEYRDILYGNNKGLDPKFRKYSIIESRQYQNIPRTIQNVFLNSKLDAEFIKQTIIMSLNEEDIKIDLGNYTHHLKDFEIQLNDINKWTEKNKSGEILVRKQAETVSKIHLAIKFLEKEKMSLARHLVWALHKTGMEQPAILDELEKAEGERNKAIAKLTDSEKAFDAKKDKIQFAINGYEKDLKEAKRKNDEYQKLNIGFILQRVSRKADLDMEEKNLQQERDLLSTQYREITQKYNALLSELENQIRSFENIKQAEKLKIQEGVQHFKEGIYKRYDQLFEDTRTEFENELSVARAALDEKRDTITLLKNRKAEIRHARLFEAEIDKLKTEVEEHISNIRKTTADREHWRSMIQNIQLQWDLEEKKHNENYEAQKEKQNKLVSSLSAELESISSKIDGSKDSLYGWLNENNPGWENTIGKVIDQDAVLFKKGLFPEKLADETSFYGIKLELNELESPIKSLADYEKEKKNLLKQIETIRKQITSLVEKQNDELDKLKRKFQSQIKELKEKSLNAEYASNQLNSKLNRATVQLNDLILKAEHEKKLALENINNEIERLSEEELTAREELAGIDGEVKKKLEQKRKERDKQISAEQQTATNAIDKINEEIALRLKEYEKRSGDILSKQERELNEKGADTDRLNEILTRLGELRVELQFIDSNRDLVAEYNKDKRELFDNVPDFKNKKGLLEKQFETEKQKYDQLRDKLNEDIKLVNDSIYAIKTNLNRIEEDLRAFDSFKITDCYISTGVGTKDVNDEYKTDKSCSFLIDELNQNYISIIKRTDDLKEAINKFKGNFYENNIFKFRLDLSSKEDYFTFAEELNEFIEEDKIAEYSKRVNERFANIIKLIGKETSDIISKEGEIAKVITDINKDFVARSFAGVIKSIELRIIASANKVVQLLLEIKKFNNEHGNSLGGANLFSSPDLKVNNEKAIGLLKQLIKEITDFKGKEITLSDSFELQFRIVENDNDTDWVEKLSNVGSDGTDVLVKAMINIMLLNVFKDGASKRFKDFQLHCMMDEIGKLHPNNVRGILKFANDRNILLINSSPTSLDSLAYRYTYLLAKDNKNVTMVKRLIQVKN